MDPPTQPPEGSSIRLTVVNLLTGEMVLDEKEIAVPLTVSNVKSNLPNGKVFPIDSTTELLEEVDDELLQSLCIDGSLKLALVVQPERVKMEKTYDNGATYVGEMRTRKNDMFRDGEGVQIWNDGAHFEGQWIDDKAHGQGKFTHAGGDTYEGQWQSDKAHGAGTYKHTDGSTYDGEWEYDRKSGAGKETWADGATYEGQYKDGSKNGDGTFNWSDGSRYVGQFNNHDIDGVGTYAWFDGREFQGQWSSNQMHGSGKYRWVDGRIYEGEYVNDHKHGHGIFVWPDGRRYEGQWVDGRQDGYGAFQTPTLSSREGYWEGGKRVRWLKEEEIADKLKAEMAQAKEEKEDGTHAEEEDPDARAIRRNSSRSIEVKTLGSKAMKRRQVPLMSHGIAIVVGFSVGVAACMLLYRKSRASRLSV